MQTILESKGEVFTKCPRPTTSIQKKAKKLKKRFKEKSEFDDGLLIKQIQQQFQMSNKRPQASKEVTIAKPPPKHLLSNAFLK